MHDVYTPGTILTRDAVREHAHARPSRAVRRVLRVCAQRAQRANEDERAFLAEDFAVATTVVLRKHLLRHRLRERRRAGDVRLKTLAELLRRLLLEGHAVRVPDIPYHQLQLEFHLPVPIVRPLLYLALES